MDTPLPPDDPKDLFLQNLELIERIADHSCRRSRLWPEERKDFVSWVNEKLIENNYAVIRRFEGRANAKFDTYLTTVIKRLLLDYQRHLWGKFHSSAEALRLGPVAVRLEQLVYRDRYSFDEACEILRTNEKVESSVAELKDLWAKIPIRTPRIEGGQELLEFEKSQERRPDQRMSDKEREGLLRRIGKALKMVLDTLPAEDRVLILMTLKLKVSEIARTRKLEQKPLYRRLDKIHETLRKGLERHGVRREDIKRLFGSLEDDLYARPKRKG